MQNIEGIMLDNLWNVYEGILTRALNKEGNGDLDLVSYTEILVDVPSKSINEVIYPIIDKYVSLYGVDIFDKKLRDSIKSGIAKISLVEDILFDEFYNKIYTYYTSR